MLRRLLAVLAAVVCLVLAAVAGHVIDQQSAPAPSLGLTAPAGPYPLHAVVFPATSRPLLNGVFTCYAQTPKKGTPYSNCRPYHVPTTTSTTLAPTTTVAPTTSTSTTTTIPTVAVPASIDATCSTDVTAQLASFINGVPSGSTVQFPVGACYLISNSLSSLLVVRGTSGLTLEGNGSTLEQTSYVGSNKVQPILDLEDNTNLTVNDLTVKGPASGGGSGNEGDYGVMANGNQTLTFDHVTIEDTEGDGLAVYWWSKLKQPNRNVLFENGTLQNIGYHGVTLEGVDGFTFENSTVNGVGNFMDLEVDAACSWPCGEVNVSVTHNAFVNGHGGDWIESDQACVPASDWSFTDNTLDASVSEISFLIGACATPNTNLTISGNVSLDNASAGTPQYQFDIAGWSGVTFTDNSTLAWAGLPTYYPNSPGQPAVTLCGSSSATITGNMFNNAATPLQQGNCWPGITTPNTDVTECGNTYWLTEPIPVGSGPAPVPDPKTDGACT